MIHIQNVSKSLGGARVLENFSLTVERGEAAALLGLSGSGKTTALKLITGLHLPDTGKITVDGVELHGGTLKEIRKKIGYVIQDGGLFPHLTAWENITIAAGEAGLSGEKLRERVSELSRMTKISEDLLSRYPRELSGGQRQRIGIIRALLLDPAVLLMDEPMGALDPITRSELQTELRELIKKLNKTVVLVTHDLYEAKFLADKIVLLAEGKILQEGSFRDLSESPRTEFVKTFVKAQEHREEA